MELTQERVEYTRRIALSRPSLGARRNGPASAETSAQAPEETLAEAIVRCSADLIVTVGRDGRIRSASPAALPLLARPAEFLAGQPLSGLVHPADRDALARLLAEPASASGADLRLSHPLGHWVELEAVAAPLTTAAGDLVLINLRDVRERKAFEEELRQHALHDPLTGLANRVLFRNHVEHALARLRHDPGRPHAVIYIDLDGFKTLNDSLGHSAGDEVLSELAGRLRARVRPGDTAARLGGDEFAILVENTTEADVMDLAAWLLDGFDSPVTAGGRTVVVTGSAGVAISAPGQDAGELVRNADVAMFAAKTAGKGRVELFRPEMQQAVHQRMVIEADLRRGLERGELFLAYQPIVAATGGHLVAVEALVRWRHPERGLIPPAEFIPVAEDSGLIRPLGRWVLEEACRQLHTWDLKVAAGRTLRMSVNTSVRELTHPGFVAQVAATLARWKLAPERLTLEITESVLVDQDGAGPVLARLRDLGIRVAVDDFGTGYSSLAYLRSLPIDVLKIDRSFVEGVTRGPEASALARAVIKLARTFGLATVAEGVEDAGQLSALAAMGADCLQGYHIARPLGPAALEEFILGGPSTPAAPATPTLGTSTLESVA